MSVRPSTMASFSVRPELTAGVSSASVAAAARDAAAAVGGAGARDTPAALTAPPRRAAVALAAGAAEGAARRADAAAAAAAAAGEDGLGRVVVGESSVRRRRRKKARVERGRTEGWLEKKSGGKEGKAKAKVMEKWNKRCALSRRAEHARLALALTSSAPRLRRWFVLPAKGTELSYFKSQKDADQQKTAAGMLPCKGAKVFLKEVKGKTFRFTIQADKRTSSSAPSTPRPIRCGSMLCLPIRDSPATHLTHAPPHLSASKHSRP